MSQEPDKELERLKRRKIEKIIENRNKPDFPDSPITLTDENFQKNVNKYPILVVDFWAEWCAPCKALAPVISGLAKKYADDIVFGKMNVDKNQILPKKFQISGIPTIIVFKNGDPVNRITGMVPRKKLEAELNKYL